MKSNEIAKSYEAGVKEGRVDTIEDFEMYMCELCKQENDDVCPNDNNTLCRLKKDAALYLSVDGGAFRPSSLKLKLQRCGKVE